MSFSTYISPFYKCLYSCILLGGRHVLTYSDSKGNHSIKKNNTQNLEVRHGAEGFARTLWSRKDELFVSGSSDIAALVMLLARLGSELHSQNPHLEREAQTHVPCPLASVCAP